MQVQESECGLINTRQNRFQPREMPELKGIFIRMRQVPPPPLSDGRWIICFLIYISDLIFDWGWSPIYTSCFLQAWGLLYGRFLLHVTISPSFPRLPTTTACQPRSHGICIYFPLPLQYEANFFFGFWGFLLLSVELKNGLFNHIGYNWYSI